VPETRNPHPQRLDIPGLVMSFVGLVLLVYGIIHASVTLTFLTPSVWVPMLVGTVILVFWIWTEARSDHRSFDVTLFRNRGYAVSLTAVSLTFFAMSGITFTLPFYFQILRGYTPLQAGLCFLPFALGQLIAAPRSAAMVDRFGYRTVMTTGLVFVTLSLVGIARMEPDWPLWAVLVVFFFFGFGMGNVIAPASTVMQNVLPLARAGAGSAVQNTVRQVFGALGVAVIGTVLATQYAAGVKPVVDQLPDGLPQEAVDAATNSVGGTVRVLDGLAAQGAPPELVAQGKQVAFDSFVSASHVTSLISLALVVVSALVVWFLLPPITPPQKGAPHGAPKPDEEGHAGVAGAHTREEADAAAAELEDSYAAEVAEEYAAPADDSK
jgi:hypothetical protein